MANDPKSGSHGGSERKPKWPPDGTADVPVGNPRPEKWYTRGYLPHRDCEQLLQSITFRLADSLPQRLLGELEEELIRLPCTRRNGIRRRQIEKWLDAGMGCCALRNSEVAMQMQASLLHFHGERYRLIAWCIMPNHVHVLAETYSPIARIVQGWKSITARWALHHNADLNLGIPDSKHFWMREYWDRFIRDEDHLRGVIKYIHENPVQARLCTTSTEWPWSSAAPQNAKLLNVGKGHAADGDVGVPRQ